MGRLLNRKFVYFYALLALLIAIGHGRYDHNSIDGDGTAFLDISQYLTDGHAKLAINGYWNPGYPAVLAAARWLTHPTRATELPVAIYTNVFIFGLAILACLFFTTGLERLRKLSFNDAATFRAGTGIMVPANALHVLGIALLIFSLGREVQVPEVKADTLLLVLFLFAAGWLLRLQAGGRAWVYAALGCTLGAAYLVKSFAFLPSIILLFGIAIFGMCRKGATRRKIVGGSLLATALFAMVAGPYIVAISRQLGHLTTGDSARLNYAFFVDQTPRWHEWYLHDLGHATGTFQHPEAVIATNPPVYSFAAHPYGTFPLWFDAAYWTAGLKPRFWLHGHIVRLERCTGLLVRYVIGRPEAFVLFTVLLGFGAKLPQRRGWRAWAVPVGWGLLMFAIYFPIDLQDRYLIAPYLLIVLPVAAWMRCREGDDTSIPSMASALVCLLAALAVTQSVSSVADARRHTIAHRGEPGYSNELHDIAGGLKELGIQPGAKVACFGDMACFRDQWGRLADAQIIAEVGTPIQTEPQPEWDAMPDPKAVTVPLQRLGVRFIVARFYNTAKKPAGWVELGGSDYYAYPIAR